MKLEPDYSQGLSVKNRAMETVCAQALVEEETIFKKIKWIATEHRTQQCFADI